MYDIDTQELERRALICADDYGGIISYSEAFYIYSIIYSASRCLDSFYRYEALKDKDILPDELISIVQEAVGHSAALSRYFWPSPGGKKKQPNLIKAAILNLALGKGCRKKDNGKGEQN